MVNIAFADDNMAHRYLIEGVIKKNENLNILFEAYSGLNLIQKIMNAPTLPDIVLVDINMPKIDGLSLIAYLGNRFEKIKIIALSVFSVKELVNEAITEGAMAYLVKNRLEISFNDAIEAVMNNRIYIDDFATMENGEVEKGIPIKEQAEKKFSDLTAVELEFLRLNATDLSYEEIAHVMFVPVTTVKEYYKSVAQKLQISHRADLTSFAVRNGLAKPARAY
jgi:DNA-binding NarL/FixJ family response regulator